jgi:hypothetical protein
VLSGVDALEEYFPLLAADWGVPEGVVPVATLGIPLAGAAGAALGGVAGRLRPATVLFAGTGLLRLPAGLVGVAVFYGLYRMAVVVTGARLQQRITGPARATVTSAAALATEVMALLVFGAWAVGGIMPVAALILLTAVGLPRLLRAPDRGTAPRSPDRPR